MRSRYVSRYVAVFLCIIAMQNGRAEDTLTVKTKIPLRQLGTVKIEHTLSIEGKDILLPLTPYNSPFRYLPLPDTSISTIQFRNCYLNVYGDEVARTAETPIHQRLEWDSNHIQYLNLAALSGEAFFYNNQIGVLSIDKTDHAQLTFNGNQLTNTIVLRYGRDLSLDFQGVSFTDTASARFYFSTIQHFGFIPNSTTESDFNFYQDSLIGDFFLSPRWALMDTSMVSVLPNTFTFRHCYINCNFVFMEEVSNARFLFEDCTFGSDVNLTPFFAYKIGFTHCRFPTESVPLSVYNSGDTLWLSVLNSDMTNVRMNFTPNVYLFWDSTTTTDAKNNTFQQLLDKFKREGRSESAQLVDIRYKQFKESGWYNFWNRVWWNYGYDKWYVFLWTIGLLTIFYFINLQLWDGMQQVYPIMPSFPLSYFEKRYGTGRKWALNFYYTIFVFFSFRINFDKLSYDKLSYVLFFLVQYIIGIWCTFFIVRTIFTF